VANAQRVGAITNYKKDDKRATFEIIEPGKEKGMKVSAWLTVGENWDESAREFKTSKPNPVVVAIDDMRASELVGPWLVKGSERYVKGQNHSYRSFNAFSIEQAPAGAVSVYTMDKDGNETNGSTVQRLVQNSGGLLQTAASFRDAKDISQHLYRISAEVEAIAGALAPADRQPAPEQAPKEVQDGWAPDAA